MYNRIHISITSFLSGLQLYRATSSAKLHNRYIPQHREDHLDKYQNITGLIQKLGAHQ